MKKFGYLWESVAGSIALTLASGLIQSTPGALVGASWYGWPVTWIRKLVIAPQYNPWVVDWYGLIIDLIFWFVVFYVIGWIICYLTGNKTEAKQEKKSKK